MKNANKLLKHDNNYSNLFNGKSKEVSVSVIMPCYNVSSSLPFVINALNNQTYKSFEIIAVDDGSKEQIYHILEDSIHPTKYIRHRRRLDRSYARNTGLTYAEGECTMILDPDIVLNEEGIEKLVRTYNTYGNNLYIGFREDIEEKVLIKKLSQRVEANYKKDIRFNYNYTTKVPLLSIFGQEKEPRKIEIYNETNYFKDFSRGRVIGSWDLASTVTGHNMFFNTNSAINLGGFDESYKGWGFDDIAFGAKMIINGYLVIPVIETVGFHIKHQTHSVTDGQKWNEFFQNQQQYFNWLNENNQKTSFNKNRDIEVIENIIP